MGTYTPKLNLFKTNMATDGNDTFDFDRDLNENLDKLEDGIGFLKYSSTAIYSLGDLVTSYSSSKVVLYRSKVNSNTGNALTNTTYWEEVKTGSEIVSLTKAQYDALPSKNPDTYYAITDDTDITLSLLQTIYPVGSIFMTTNSTCPLQALFGTWTKVASGVVTSVTSNAPVKGNGKTLGLSDGTTNYGLANINGIVGRTGSYNTTAGTSYSGTAPSNVNLGITTDSSKSGMVATVSSSSYTCNLFRRTA